MKAATGELNLTVITIIAIGAVLTFFWLFWDNIQDAIEGEWNEITDSDRDTTHTNIGMNTIEVDDYQFLF